MNFTLSFSVAWTFANHFRTLTLAWWWNEILWASVIVVNWGKQGTYLLIKTICCFNSEVIYHHTIFNLLRPSLLKLYLDLRIWLLQSFIALVRLVSMISLIYLLLIISFRSYRSVTWAINWNLTFVLLLIFILLQYLSVSAWLPMRSVSFIVLWIIHSVIARHTIKIPRWLELLDFMILSFNLKKSIILLFLQ